MVSIVQTMGLCNVWPAGNRSLSYFNCDSVHLETKTDLVSVAPDGHRLLMVRVFLMGNNTAAYVDALVLTKQAAATRKGGRGGAGGQFRREGGPADVFGAAL